MECPSCKVHIKAQYCPELEDELRDPRQLYDIVLAKAIERGKADGIDKEERFRNPNDAFYNDFKGYCMSHLTFYQCFKCQVPYFGGRVDCGEAENQNQGVIKKEDLICGPCTAEKIGVGKGNCAKHGIDYIEFKCRYCCSIALWFCFGTTHFCEPCHQIAFEAKPKPCPGKNLCPLKVDHPESGNEFALGCGLCKNNIDALPPHQMNQENNLLMGIIREIRRNPLPRRNAPPRIP